LIAVFSFAGCGDVTWFVSWNTFSTDTDLNSGLVVIIGTPVQPQPKAVSLSEGSIPPGMAIHPDATVRGKPTETGDFDFTLDIDQEDGGLMQENFKVHVHE